MISIIMPTYNSANYIMRAIKSCLKQTYKDFELIIINDGSTDKTLLFINKVKDSRVKVISHSENLGIGQSRKDGIELASGEYVAFVDSDDWIDTDYLQTMYDLITSNDVDIVSCGIRKMLTNTLLELTLTYLKEGVFQTDTLLAQEHPWFNWFYNNKLIKKSILNLFDYNTNRLREDEVSAYILFSKASTIYCTAYAGYNYYINLNGLCCSSSLAKCLIFDTLSAAYMYKYDVNNQTSNIKYSKSKFLKRYYKLNNISDSDKELYVDELYTINHTYEIIQNIYN